uniref:Secreted protein n=1 Tax=Rhizophora mucronata TaxID=61149 RepID=A0A2P2QQP9_RHIMU
MQWVLSWRVAAWRHRSWLHLCHLLVLASDSLAAISSHPSSLSILPLSFHPIVHFQVLRPGTDALVCEVERLTWGLHWLQLGTHH